MGGLFGGEYCIGDTVLLLLTAEDTVFPVYDSVVLDAQGFLPQKRNGNAQSLNCKSKQKTKVKDYKNFLK